MITFTKSYQTSDNKVFADIALAQAHEIELLLLEAELEPKMVPGFASAIVDAREKVVDVLTTTATSKTKARAVNGGRKPRKAKVATDDVALAAAAAS